MTIESKRNHVLEDAIRRAPADLDAYEVYADWLIERGEPHGELILFDVNRRRVGPTRDFAVLAAEARLLSDRRRIFGELGDLTSGAVDWELELGFLKSMRINAQGEDAGRALRLALEHRVGAFLRELVVQKPYGLSRRQVVTDERKTARSIWNAILDVGLPPTVESIAVPIASDGVGRQCHALAQVARCTFPLLHAPAVAPHVSALTALRSLTFVGTKYRDQLSMDALLAHADAFSDVERLELVTAYGADLAPLRAALPRLVVSVL